ncbi:TPA: hypothetical protein SB731_000427 [Campylobacter jejuni]|nr:hypothetical protein [Campylobacter jejuni]HEF7954992.1 hypothetical protein [Campylobacter jejuni]HEF7959880.1 hypothetical protein [Campylobacter jejuni]HEF7967884.1 hypothetical protein [Campylobacter jejuni]HEF7975141.1 hypothetical protein [Campylobacter jejuni]
MPVPFILGGIALAAGAFGAKKAYDGHQDKNKAKKSTIQLIMFITMQEKSLKFPKNKLNKIWKILVEQNFTYMKIH